MYRTSLSSQMNLKIFWHDYRVTQARKTILVEKLWHDKPFFLLKTTHSF